MQFSDTELPGVILVEPKVFEDERGFFFESYHEQRFVEKGLSLEFCQDKLAKYKWPLAVEFRDELPKSAVGKILRKELRAEELAK